ncbi:MAG: hypothetical protein HY376_03145 [Candidatus Blackburnbacteria bacterium]|nr:hypothetical protein [Candidatus Blackburnbacteria bacterium]
MTSRLFTILLILAILMSAGCAQIQQFLNPAPPQAAPVETVTEPVVVNVTDATNVTVEVVSPLFDYRIPRIGNATFYFLQLSGDAVVIIGSFNETILLDTGADTDYRTLVLALRNWGVERIDALVVSRNLPFVSSNIEGLASQFSITKVYHNGLAEFQQPFSNLKDVVPIEAVTVDRTIQVGSLQLKLIVPYDDGKGYSQDENQNSILTRITYGKASVLYASGCDFTCEGRVANSDLKAQLLVTALKGSCDGSTAFFLNKVQPEAAVTMGAPCAEVVQRLQTIGIKDFNTNKDGTLAFTTDGFGTFLIGGQP